MTIVIIHNNNKQSESQLELGWLWNFVFLTSEAVVQKSIHLAVTVLSVNEHQVELYDITI